jgi:hypothetical protein
LHRNTRGAISVSEVAGYVIAVDAKINRATFPFENAVSQTGGAKPDARPSPAFAYTPPPAPNSVSSTNSGTNPATVPSADVARKQPAAFASLQAGTPRERRVIPGLQVSNLHCGEATGTLEWAGASEKIAADFGLPG